MKTFADLDNKRLQDIHFKISCYNYRVVHIKGAKNKMADCLSHLPMLLANKDSNYETVNISRFLVSHSTTKRDVFRLIKHSPAGPSIENR